MNSSIARFCLGVCIVAVALVLHRLSEDEATSRARLEGYESGYRAWSHTQLDLTAACQRGPQQSATPISTVAGQ
jgi:hypothetical protein